MDEADRLFSYCGSPFWDANLTWHTEDPRLTPCFQNTVLIWVPCLFLWVFSAYEVYCALNSKYRNIPWNWLNIAKCVVLVLLIILELISFGRAVGRTADGSEIWPQDIVAPILLMATFTVAFFLGLLLKARGIRTSGVLFLFWLLMVIAGIPAYRYHISSASQEDIKDIFQFGVYMVYYPLVVCELLLQCFADPPPTISPEEKGDSPCPEESASFLSKIVFFWFDKLTWNGYRRPLETEDLWDLNTRDASKTLVPSFQKIHNYRIQKAQQSSGEQDVEKNKAAFIKNGPTVEFSPVKTEENNSSNNVSLLPTLCRAFWSTFALGAFLKLISDMLNFVSPQILKLLISYVANNEEEWKGYLYATILFLTSVVQTVVLGQYFQQMFAVGMNIRTALISAIYRKSLKMSTSSRKESTVGEIVNLMSVDVQRLMDLTIYLNLLWSGPLQIILCLYFLWQTLGPSVMSGLAVMILLIPVNGFVAKKVQGFQVNQMKNKDERVKLMNEVLSGMKVLKLYGWEPSFEDQITGIRKNEINVMKHAAYFNAAIWFVWTVTPFLVSLASFGTYVMVDESNVLDAETIFVSLTLFNILRVPLMMVPMMIVSVVQANVSLKRLDKFMNSDDVDPQNVIFDSNEVDPVVVDHGTFSWESKNDEAVCLRNINMRVKDGSLVAVVGSVGSGKSSLLSAVLGEMNKINGLVKFKGSVAYVQQQPWIQNVTLKENILFGKEMDQRVYSGVLEACALKPDLQMLPAGDNTEIGEKGINLSGGQKQRVSVARAVYSDACVYLLDDPLSAVDSHVGRHIFEKVIGPEGLLRRKTRILVTHAITYLPQVDQIIVMTNGEISEVGTYTELLQKKGAFADYLLEHLTERDEEAGGDDGMEEIMQHLTQTMGEEEIKRKVSRRMSRQYSDDHNNSMNELNRRLSRTESTPEKNSLLRRTSSSVHGDDQQSDTKPKKVPGEEDKIIEKEKTETGNVKFAVYLYYIKAASIVLLAVGMFSHLMSQGFTIGSNVWLAIWSGEAALNNTQNTEKRDMYLGVYTALGFGQAVATLILSLALNIAFLTAARKRHDDMLKNILRCPMSFFDTTPLGRIVNRFSKDVDALDTAMPAFVNQWMYFFFEVIATIAVICGTTPIFLTVILPVGVIYFFVQQFYIATSRQLKRLESVSRSPIYSHFGETLTGATTIRAYKHQERFIADSEMKVDRNQICYYPSIVANRWLAVRLETVGNILIFFAALFSILGRETLSPGLVGLSITYALQITMNLNFLVRSSCDVETNIVSVERVKEYSETEQEAPWELPLNKPPRGWPTSGKIIFKNYQTRYREGLDLVLKGISCEIQPREKIGIVGRTGAGKSSLTLAIFRIIEPAGGQILIDEVDLSKLGLHDIRGSLTIIPQDPVLFSGTLRLNLDPFSKYKDEELWKALEQAHLKNFVQGLGNGLMHEVAEGGENLSVGQRQLVCLARALLRKTTVLILDEATAAVDLETDDLIQKTIRSEFADCTILTIAHRLNTIMDSTRVMVLDSGLISEFDSPANLLKNHSSSFYSMAKDAGLV